MNLYTYEMISVGMEESFQVQITEEMMHHFLAITGDVNPLHADIEYAKEKNYPSRVVYGMLTASFMSTLAGVYLPGKYSLIHSIEVKFTKPVFIGDTLTINGIIHERNDLFRLFTMKVTITNQDNVKVSRGTMKVGILDE